MTPGGRCTTGEEQVNRTWLGVGIVAILALALIIVLASGGDDVPATTTTAPPTAAPTTAPPTMPTTVAPTTTTTAAPTTTLDPAARAAEIEALVGNLEFALWEADYAQNLDELADVIGSEAFWNRWTGVEDPLSYYSSAPTRDSLDVALNAVLLDRANCIVADVTEDPTQFLNEDSEIERLIIVMWPFADASLGWRIAERWAGGTPESEWIRDCNVEDRSWRP